MPTRRDRPDAEELTDKQERWLRDGDCMAMHLDPDPPDLWVPFPSMDAAARAWDEHGERITREYVEDNPGSRPQGWWRFEYERRPPTFVEDRPEGAPRDLENEAAVLLELGELGEEERGRCPAPGEVTRSYLRGEWSPKGYPRKGS